MGRRIYQVCCMTLEQFNEMKDTNFVQGLYHITPGKFYVNKTGSNICLVTSREWCNWLVDITDVMPTNL